MATAELPSHSPAPPEPFPAGERLDRVFAPRSIVVVGASTDPAKRGNQAIRALRESGCRAEVFGVNPRGGSAHGVDFATSLAELPHGIDVALLALPGRLVPDTLRELDRHGVSGAVVLANGFAEAGEGGTELTAQLDAAIRETNIRVVGPNTSGVLNVPLGVNLVGVPSVPAGPITVLTQSGNMLLSLLEDNKAMHGPGFAAYVGLGNQSDLSYHECVEHFATDPATGVIAIHSEGLTDGRAFLQAAARASRICPVVMLRGGRSVVGQRAALSHTGSVAGSDEVATAVLRQAGVELVERSDELAVVSAVLATTQPPVGSGAVAILSDGGGHATLATDALVAAGVPLADLSPTTTERLQHLLGQSAAVNNPVDVAGATDADPTVFAGAAEILFEDSGVDMILVIGLFGGYHIRFDPRLRESEHKTSTRLVDLSAQHHKPVLVQSCYAGEPIENHEVLRRAGIQVLTSIDHAVRAVSALTRRGARLLGQEPRSCFPSPAESPVPTEPFLVDEPAARTLLDEAGISTGPWRFVDGPDALERAINDLGVPCAVKVVSAQVVHKSDAGGVRLGVLAADAARTWREITSAVAAHVPDATIDGMVVVPMARSGLELLVGARQDPIFGPIVAFGSGGVLVEATRDVSFRAAPLTEVEAHELIAETAAARMLDGFRHFLPVDRDALADLLVRVGDLVSSRSQIRELDLNPVIARGDSLTPVDARIVMAKPASDQR